MHPRDQPTVTFGGVTCRLDWSSGGRAVIRTHGGGTKSTIYTFDPESRTWLGKQPNYEFGLKLIQAFGL